MRSNIVLKCMACGAPAADSVAICPYCCKATGFASLANTEGIEMSEAGSMRISDGAHVQVGVSDVGAGTCPFCGANASPGATSCEYCKAKLVIERMRLARLVISGGSMSIGGGGKVEIVGRQCRAIHRAAAADDLATVKTEIQEGDDPDFEDEDGKRPLHYAAAAGALSTAQWLLSIGANPNARDEQERTPLHTAKAAGHTALADLFSMYSAS